MTKVDYSRDKILAKRCFWINYDVFGGTGFVFLLHILIESNWNLGLGLHQNIGFVYLWLAAGWLGMTAYYIYFGLKKKCIYWWTRMWKGRYEYGEEASAFPVLHVITSTVSYISVGSVFTVGVTVLNFSLLCMSLLASVVLRKYLLNRREKLGRLS